MQTFVKTVNVPIILDDRNARELAHTLGLDFGGTGAMLLEARLVGLLDKKEFMENLRELGKVTWLSPEVVAELIRLSEEEPASMFFVFLKTSKEVIFEE